MQGPLTCLLYTSKAVRIKNLGVTRYGLSGSNGDVLADMGLDADGIAGGAKELLK